MKRRKEGFEMRNYVTRGNDKRYRYQMVLFVFNQDNFLNNNVDTEI